MANRKWIATHTGLPSFSVDAGVRVTTGARVLWPGEQAGVFSDALAAPGVPTTYQVGRETVTLTRRTIPGGGMLLTGTDGRPVDGLTAWNNQDPMSWKSDASIIDDRLTRWSMRTPLHTGKTHCVLPASAEADAWRVLRARGHIIIAPGDATPGVPARMVTVTSVNRERLGADGTITLTVQWADAGPLDVERIGGGAVAVVTWGDWQAWSDRTGNKADQSEETLARLIAGMPS